MSQDVELGCRCGRAHGWASGVSPRGVIHALCYCDDCQAFAHWLGRADLLDDKGGTEVVQVAPNAVRFDRGADAIAGVRLSPKGMYRWYATCCQTPLGNTLTPALPFIGMGIEVLLPGAPDAQRREALFGPVRGALFGQFAIGGAPPGSTQVPWRLYLHSARLLLGWKLRRTAWPHPFFERATGQPSHPVTTLSPEERAALRPKCGPNPAPAAA